METTNIFLKLYVEDQSESLLCKLEKEAGRLIGSKYQLADSSCKKYWKIPEYLEFELVFRGPNIDMESFMSIANNIGSGWEFQNLGAEYSGIWNPGDENSFAFEGVKWSEIGFYSD